MLAMLSVAAALQREIVVDWKPQQPMQEIPEQLDNMTATLSATYVNIYCGYGALSNGSFGIVPRNETPEHWGDIRLCKPAVQHALSKGLGVGIVVEKRLPFTAAWRCQRPFHSGTACVCMCRWIRARSMLRKQ